MSTNDSIGTGCAKCADQWDDFPITMAFQPIVDVTARQVFAYEALVRGAAGQSAMEVLAHITDANRHSFDQLCRATAIQHAAELGMQSFLSINFLPNAVYNPINCLASTIAAAEKFGFPIQRLIFEVTESEEVRDRGHLANIIGEYRKLGITVAIDDFGAGHSGLNMLVDINPDIVKLDRFLIIDIHQNKRKQAIVRAIANLCRDLDTKVICEGIETKDEIHTVLDLGVHLVQGYLLARPAVAKLNTVDYDAL